MKTVIKLLEKATVVIMVLAFIVSNTGLSCSYADDIYISAGETMEITVSKLYVKFVPSETAVYNLYSTSENGADPRMYIYDSTGQIKRGDDEMGLNFFISIQLEAGVEYTLRCFNANEKPYTLNVELNNGGDNLEIKSMELSISEETPFLVKGQLSDGEKEVGYIRSDDHLFRFLPSAVKEVIILNVVYEDDSTEQWHYTPQETLFNKKEVTYEISETSLWEPDGDNLVTVTYEGITKSISVPVSNLVEIKVDGVSISPVAEGERTVYSITDTTGCVTEVGLVYGLKNYITDSDLYVGNSSENVFDYKATQIGILKNQNGGSGTTRYAMTMIFGNVGKRFFEEPLSLRAYAKLDNGCYMYSDVVNYSIYDVASYLYENKMMPIEDGHNYLYNNILKKVDGNYSEIPY
jgi:hypothetical protein